MYGENIDLNEPNLGLRKKGAPLEIREKELKIIHPDNGIFSKFIHIIGVSLHGGEDSSLTETREACSAAVYSKEAAIGAALVHVNRQMSR